MKEGQIEKHTLEMLQTLNISRIMININLGWNTRNVYTGRPVQYVLSSLRKLYIFKGPFYVFCAEQLHFNAVGNYLKGILSPFYNNVPASKAATGN